MKTSNIIYVLLAILTINLVSCQDEDKGSIFPSQSKFNLEAEGEEIDIHFNNDNWQILAVINKNGDQRIFGDIFSPDGKIIKENALLELEGPGQLNAHWWHKGFTISRDKPNALTIKVKENLSGEEFNFAIILQNEDGTKEIVVNQKISQGYTFDKIEYYLQEDDKDSLYFKRGIDTFTIGLSGVIVTIPPFDGIEYSLSHFESDEKDVFLWLNEKSINIQVPQDIHNSKIILSEKKHNYSEFTETPYINNTVTTIEIPAGYNNSYFDLEWRIRQVSYALTLTNNRTKDKKSIQGKWIEERPTGNYQFIIKK